MLRWQWKRVMAVLVSLVIAGIFILALHKGDNIRDSEPNVNCFHNQNPQSADLMVLVTDESGPLLYYVNRDLATVSDVLLQRCRSVSFSFTHTPKPRFPSGSFPILHLCFAMGGAEHKCQNNHNLLPFQQIIITSSFPTFRQTLWRKDVFCRTMNRWLRNNAEQYVIPCVPFTRDDMEPVRKFVRIHSDASAFVVKPASRGEGRGIFTVSTPEDIERIVQHPSQNDGMSQIKYTLSRFQPNPLLIEGYKVDLRCYVILTSTAPSRAFIFPDCLVRFAKEKYDSTAKRGGRRSQWMTNTHLSHQRNTKVLLLSQLIEKENVRHELTTRIIQNEENRAVSNSELLEKLIAKISGILRPIFLASELELNHQQRRDSSRSAYQLLGVDVFVSSSWNMRIIEINGLPSLSQQIHNEGYIRLKYSLLHATFDIVGICIQQWSIMQRSIDSKCFSQSLPLDALTEQTVLQRFIRSGDTELGAAGDNRLEISSFLTATNDQLITACAHHVDAILPSLNSFTSNLEYHLYQELRVRVRGLNSGTIYETIRSIKA